MDYFQGISFFDKRIFYINLLLNLKYYITMTKYTKTRTITYFPWELIVLYILYSETLLLVSGYYISYILCIVYIIYMIYI